MVTKKTWQDFRDTGLFMFVNTILHAFGWALVVEVDKDSEEVTDCYPARVKFRGFTESDQEEMHKKIGNYLADNSVELAKEATE
jgi:hypothetical protein